MFSYIPIFLVLFPLISPVEIYINPSNPCTYNCGSSSNPFPSLTAAFFALDGLLESNSIMISQYPDLSMTYNSSTCEFILASGETHYFNYTEMQELSPCDDSAQICLYRFLLHWNGPAYETLIISSPNLTNLIFMTHSAMIYANITANLNFENISFYGDCQWVSCFQSDSGLFNGIPYSFIVGYYPWTTQENQSSNVYLVNCTIENFFTNQETKRYTHFIGFDQDMSSYPSYYKPFILVNFIFVTNVTIRNSSLLGSLFAVQSGNFYLTNSLVWGIPNLFTISLFNSSFDSPNPNSIPSLYSCVVMQNTVFYYTDCVVETANYTNIYLYQIEFLNRTTWNGGVVFNLDGWNNNMEIYQTIVNQSTFGSFLNCNSSYLYMWNVTFSNIFVSGILMMFSLNNQIYIQNCLFAFIEFASYSYYIGTLLFQFDSGNYLSSSFNLFLNLNGFSSLYSLTNTGNFLNFSGDMFENLTVSPSPWEFPGFLITSIYQNQISFNSSNLIGVAPTYTYQGSYYAIFYCFDYCTLNINNVSIILDSLLINSCSVVYLTGTSNNLNINQLSVSSRNPFTTLPAYSIVNNSGLHYDLEANNNSVQLFNLSGYFVGSDNFLYNCNVGCQTCNNNVSNCSACFSEYYYIKDGSCQPFSICGSGNYYDSLSGNCSSCSYDCQYCTNDNSCSSCNPYYFLDGSKCSYISNCEQLNDDLSECSLCWQGFYLDNLSTCASCNTSIIGCNNCSNDGSNCYCSDGYYINDSTCVSCEESFSNCESCSNGSQCDVCDNGYFEINGTCESCQDQFSNCQSCNPDNCTYCMSGYYINNNTCVPNNFALTFPSGIIGQFYHFSTQECLSFENQSNYSRQMFMPCNGLPSAYSSFKIIHVRDDLYSIIPMITTQSQLAVNCGWSYNDYMSHFMVDYIDNSNNDNNNNDNSSNSSDSSNYSDSSNSSDNSNISYSDSDNNASNSTYSDNNSNNSVSDNSSSNSSSDNSSNNSSLDNSSSNSSSCLQLNNFTCNGYYDYYQFNNDNCIDQYNNETSLWKLQIINDSNAFGDSRYSLLLANPALNNLCLSYSNDGLLQPCDPNSFDFLFGFKITDISQIENQLTSNLTGYSDTIEVTWIDYTNITSEENFIFVIYYFTDFTEFTSYICGSDKSDSPINFTQYIDENGFNVVTTNLTLNDLVTCGCLSYQDSDNIYFEMKAANFDSENNLVFADFYTIIFSKIAGFNKTVYAGYTTDSNGTQGEIIENDKPVTYLNVSQNLNVSLNNLISNKYLDKNVTQSIHVSYNSNNRFNMSLLNNIVSFVISTQTLNETYNITSTSSSNSSNELDISFDLATLPSGYYSLDFYIYFQLMTRLLTNSSDATPSNFTSNYVTTGDFYVGTTDEIQQKVIEDQENNNQNQSESKLDVKMLIIWTLTGLIGFFLILIPAFYFMHRYRKVKRNQMKGQDYACNIKDKIKLASDTKGDDKSPELLFENHQL